MARSLFMPIYFYWGEDDFTITIAVQKLKASVLDPDWIQFNYQKIAAENPDSPLEALNTAMTPVFGIGERLIWLNGTNICQNCSSRILAELERTLPKIPETSHLLFTAIKKPDRRLKSTKLLEKYAEFKEFSPLSPWKIDEIVKQTEQFAKEIDLNLTADSLQFIAESVGNNSRQLWQELEKLSLYGKTKTLNPATISTLINCNSRNSIDLAKAILHGNKSLALESIELLINRNEPPLKIIATLVGQFRTWSTVKLIIEKGRQSDREIAKAAEISNFYRIKYLRQEIQSISSQKLLASLPILLEVEYSLKRGEEAKSSLQIAIIKLCQIFQQS